MRWLLDAGVPVDLRDEEQRTALHYAVEAEQEAVRSLSSFLLVLSLPRVRPFVCLRSLPSIDIRNF